MSAKKAAETVQVNKGFAVSGLLSRESVGKAMVHLEKFIETVEPYVKSITAHCNSAWAVIEPYHPEELGEAFCGLIMLFFGGSFMTTIAAIEAFRIVGYHSTLNALKSLIASYKAARSANAKDDEKDDNGDGVKDVKQISADQLAIRKLMVISKAVDPVKVEEALVAFSSGIFAVVATLRARFVKAVTLGATLGEYTNKVITIYVVPMAENSLPPDAKKWIEPTARMLSKMIGVTVAWMMMRVISAFHSSVRGAELFVRGLLSYCVRHGYCSPMPEQGQQFSMIVGFIAFFGFWTQFTNGFTLFFPLNILLFPVRMVEWYLKFWIAAD